MPSAFVFLGTPANFGDNLPFRLSPRLVLRRASASEITSIQKYLDGLSPTYPCAQIFESDFEKEVEYAAIREESIKIECQNSTKLPREQWRYNVVSITRYEGFLFGEEYSDLIQLRVSSQLSSRPLFLNTATTRRIRHSLDFAADWHHYVSPTDSEYKVINFQRRDLEDWRATLQLLASVKATFPLVWH
ncbi:MAG: hypothetical protein CVV14_04295 [Gammaproteobacteria bacterium HGW-Gammaproteobacteria-4]|jgi:hypothetical protein|nr:MAG: hypothetical protein CVV14_04295 [Gammaproteobacteria bacterium HGW-Gammaproteobacteria-4]